MMIVYLLTNLVNEKKYVGITKRSLTQRINEHIFAAKHGAKFPLSRALRKYGIDNFDVTIIEECVDEAQLRDQEKYWIEQYDTFKLGYNATMGGDGLMGYKHSEDVKRRMGESRRGEKNCNFGKKGWGFRGPHSEETKLKLSKIHLGKKHSQETCEKISDALRKRVRNCFIVVQCDLNDNVVNTFLSVKIASIETGHNSNRIGDCCRGKRKTHHGYKWKYVSRE